MSIQNTAQEQKESVGGDIILVSTIIILAILAGLGLRWLLIPNMEEEVRRSAAPYERKNERVLALAEELDRKADIYRELAELGEPVEVRAIESAGGSVSYVFVLPDGSLRQAMP